MTNLGLILIFFNAITDNWISDIEDGHPTSVICYSHYEKEPPPFAIREDPPILMVV
jgi:hypothetical protein